MPPVPALDARQLPIAQLQTTAKVMIPIVLIGGAK
jgi:hypothetical protein